jgi:uncharacterized LabA/DUF88 family protein
MSLITGYSEAPKPIARLMAFIDGGYLRENFKKATDNAIVDFAKLEPTLVGTFDGNCRGMYHGDLIRTYFYDAIVDRLHPKYDEQNEYHSAIKNCGIQVVLSRLKPSGNNGTGALKQKGVDVRLAVDMVTKAYQNHYDYAILLAGDDDFLDAVKAVKDYTGKRVLGIFFNDTISSELRDEYDIAYSINNFVNILKKI